MFLTNELEQNRSVYTINGCECATLSAIRMICKRIIWLVWWGCAIRILKDTIDYADN